MARLFLSLLIVTCSSIAGPYCRKYETQLHHFSPRGQVFLNYIKICLQKKIEMRRGENCGDASDDFVQAHVKCYLHWGFCEIPFLDKVRIRALGLGALRDREFRQAGREIERGCSRHSLTLF